MSSFVFKKSLIEVSGFALCIRFNILFKKDWSTFKNNSLFKDPCVSLPFKINQSLNELNLMV